MKMSVVMTYIKRQMTRILIAGIAGTAAQNFIKALKLSNEKYYVVGIEHNRFYLDVPLQAERVYYLKHSKSFVNDINALVAKENIELLYAAPDIMVKRFSNYRDQLHAKLFLPHSITLGICANKLQTYSYLNDAKIPVPETFAFNEIDKKLFAKHKHWWVRMCEGAGSRAALPIDSLAQAENWVRYWVEKKEAWPTHFIISEFLPGREFGHQSLWHNGELITSCARERLEYVFGHLMPSGQSSSPSVARIVHDSRVNDIALRAVRAVSPQPHGVFGVDMKENANGDPCVTEINAGRFYTTSDFIPFVGGVNMPHLYCQLAMRQEIAKDLPRENGATEGKMWIRGIDREPIAK